MTTVEQARKLLGEKYAGLSDEEINTLIKQMKRLSDFCVDKINKKINDCGTNLLSFMVHKEK